jgi:type I restriction-modification system DNA methylase subunit
MDKSPDNIAQKHSHKTERSAVAILMHWMRNIISEKKIDLGAPDVETIGADRKSPDTVIYESPGSQKVLCVIEAKPSYFNVYSEDDLIIPARNKANQRKARYFATTNFKQLIWFDTEKANALLPEQEQIIDIINLSAIDNLDSIEHAKFSEPIKRNLEIFLIKLYEVHRGIKAAPRLPIDDKLVLRLHETIRVLSVYYNHIIYEKFSKDSSFKKDIKKWLKEQNWVFSFSFQEFEKIARQTAYLLINKILFYELLQIKRPERLDPLEVPESLMQGSSLRNLLEGRFKHVYDTIDYETVFTTDFIDVIAFPDAIEVVKEIKEFIKVLRRYDFGKLGYDIIGRIFEKLIPDRERHQLGQFFTRSDVVDLILGFCLHHENDKVLDPSCGAGTFLKRAYQHKKMMNSRIEHIELLDKLWGNDIAKFPATLSTINLAINDLTVDKNYPNIIQEDFFALKVAGDGLDLEKWRKRRASTLGIKDHEITYPRFFDAIVGNPPYTRQEEIEMPEIGVDKGKLIKNALYYNDIRLADISKRAGIYAYFFVHGTKFLKENGYFGFIVSNSWLDVDYGKGLQEFFLNNYKMIAIIESKIERWFPEADINTCIIILQKCRQKKERDKNSVRFVYLKKPLEVFIPMAEETWEQELKRKNAIEKFIDTVMAHNKLYENDELRIFPVKQKELWKEGFDPDQEIYIGAKWGKYLRAPEIFFKILKKSKNKLVPLGSIAKVRRGFTTGANEFFYLAEEQIKRRKIERSFWMHKDKKGKWVPNYVMIKPNESSKIKIDPHLLQKRVLFIKKDKGKLLNKNVLSYINRGEKLNYDDRPTCSSRKMTRQWYSLGENINSLIAFPERIRQRHIVFYNPDRVSLNKNLYGIEPNDKRYAKSYSIMLNSTIVFLLLEVMARQPGGGGAPLDIDVMVAKEILFPDLKLLKKHNKRIVKSLILERKFENIFQELGASSPENIKLENILPDRRELDKIIMGDVLGLTEPEQLEVYKAVVDLVKSRIEKARSVDKNNNDKELDYTLFTTTALHNILGESE